jgi:gluconolactonase
MLKDGKLTVVDKNPEGSFPNGVAFSPDEKHLYGTAGDKVVRYDVHPDGALSNRILFVDMPKAEGPGGPDGFKVDTKGNLWTGGPGGLWIVSPEGKHLGTVKIPATNLAFGGADGKTLFIVGRGGVVSHIAVKIPGIHPIPKSSGTK